jgi:DNA-binding LacI/PurR family transcriptional regulator
VVPFFTRPFYVDILRGVERALAETRYSLVVFNVERVEDRNRLLDTRLDTRIDGVVIISLMDDTVDMARLRGWEAPIVAVDCASDGLPFVTIDHEDAAYQASKHLLDQGHTRIALIDRAQNPFDPATSCGRREGYWRALHEAKVAPQPDYLRLSDYSHEAGHVAAHSLLSLATPPTAIFAASDAQAVGVLEAATARGLRVPHDLAVVGYNDVELAAFAGLTTIRLPMQEMGHLAAIMLLDLIEGRTPDTSHHTLRGELIIRRTTVP